MKPEDKSLEEIYASVDTTQKTKGWKRIFAFLGPAYLVSVGYMDPGNWATDIAGGSKYGYSLLWVLLMSNIMAIVLQSLCARLGIARNKDLAQINRETYPPIINFCLYILAELAIAATDLAEIIGMAIGLNLLCGLPLVWGVSITAFDSLLLLYLQKLGIRKMEAFIIGIIAIIFISFGIEIYLVKPQLSEIGKGLIPHLQDKDALYIAIGIIGATVMPHNLYLHSALVQTRKIGKDDISKKKAIKWNIIDSSIALNLALFVNAAILILAAATFHQNGLHEIESIEDAHRLLEPLVGNQLAPILFAVALIAAGQSSTVTGTLAGQIVMEGYLQIRLNPWARRLITRLVAIVPALIAIWIAGEKSMTDLLILSQVILSVQLAFAIIPLIYAVSNKHKMGNLVAKPYMIAIAVLIATIVIVLNILMVYNESLSLIKLSENNLYIKIIIIAAVILLSVLLLCTILLPLLYKYNKAKNDWLHSHINELNIQPIQPYQCIAVALDFGKKDNAVISNAIHHLTPKGTLVLIHIVESATAKVLGNMSKDRETEGDLAQLEKYATQLEKYNIQIIKHLGYRRRAKEIARICNEQNVEMLVMGAHGHKGIKDILYGHTIEQVRHLINIPVLVVQ